MKYAIALILATTVIPAIAQSSYNYDWQTGNSTTTTKNYDGSTTINGVNTKTGAVWNTNVNRQGDMRGTDGGGNPWQYNNTTKTYNNYGTGKSCTGQGYGRICN